MNSQYELIHDEYTEDRRHIKAIYKNYQGHELIIHWPREEAENFKTFINFIGAERGRGNARNS